MNASRWYWRNKSSARPPQRPFQAFVLLFRDAVHSSQPFRAILQSWKEYARGDNQKRHRQKVHCLRLDGAHASRAEWPLPGGGEHVTYLAVCLTHLLYPDWVVVYAENIARTIRCLHSRSYSITTCLRIKDWNLHWLGDWLDPTIVAAMDQRSVSAAPFRSLHRIRTSCTYDTYRLRSCDVRGSAPRIRWHWWEIIWGLFRPTIWYATRTEATYSWTLWSHTAEEWWAERGLFKVGSRKAEGLQKPRLHCRVWRSSRSKLCSSEERLEWAVSRKVNLPGQSCALRCCHIPCWLGQRCILPNAASLPFLTIAIVSIKLGQSTTSCCNSPLIREYKPFSASVKTPTWTLRLAR